MSDNTSNGHATTNAPHFDQLKPYDLAALKTYDLSSRPSKVFHDDLGQPCEPGTSAEGFFRAEGDTLVPAPFATSPWGQVLHGRLIGGLTARAAEQARAEVPELACARLTVDLFRSVPLAPVRVTASPVRSGRRATRAPVPGPRANSAAGPECC